MSQVKGFRSRPNSAEFKEKNVAKKPTSNGNAEKRRPNSAELLQNERNNSAPKPKDDAGPKEIAPERSVPLAIEEEANVIREEASAIWDDEKDGPPVAVEEEEETRERTEAPPNETEATEEKSGKETPPNEEDEGRDESVVAVLVTEDEDGRDAPPEVAREEAESKRNGSLTIEDGEKESAGLMATRAELAPPKKYEIIAVRERHGLFRKAVPVMPLVPAVVFCLLNVVAPGIGTLCAAFAVVRGCPTEHDNRAKSFSLNIVAALLQLITAPIVVGWVWSIFWGVTFVNVSVSKGADETMAVPVTARV